MSSAADELKLDIDELRNLLQHVSRQRCKDLITVAIRKLETKVAELTEEDKISEIKPNNVIPKSSQKRCDVKLTTYSWKQTSTTVQIYITLKDVHKLPTEAVTCNFTDQTLDLRIEGLENKNYTFTINNLCEDIDPNTSSVKTKTNMVVISLPKKVQNNWSHISKVEKRLQEAKKLKSDHAINNHENATTSVINLMKLMYEEGDDEMKRSISKIWTERVEKRSAGLSDD